MEFDLNIHNYNIVDLEQLFKLKPELKYSVNEIEYKEYQLREQLFRTGYINKQLKPNIVQFLSLAKTRLIHEKCVPSKKTSIMPESWRLDKSEIPRLEHVTSRETELVVKPQASYTYTHNSDYFQGTLNPLEKRIVTKSISIDSLFRNNYNSTNSGDYIYTLPETLNNVTSMKLSALEISNSWFAFSSKNNTNMVTITTYFYTTQGFREVITSKLITIPDGNYLSDDFVTLFNGLLKDASLNNISINISEFSTKTIFYILPGTTLVPIPTNFSFTIDFRNPSSIPDPTNTNIINELPNSTSNKSMGWMLGFREPFYKVEQSTGKYYANISGTIKPVIYAGYLESEGGFGSLNDTYIFVDVDDYHNNFPTNSLISINHTNQSYLGQNILGRISMTAGQNVTQMNMAQDQITKRREYFGPIKLEKLRIRLLNRFGDVLAINNNDYSLLLEFTQLYS